MIHLLIKYGGMLFFSVIIFSHGIALPHPAEVTNERSAVAMAWFLFYVMCLAIVISV